MATQRRKAEAYWEGSLDTGKGFVSTESKLLAEAKYAFKTRTGDGRGDTNPEELIAAAAASCFCMALSKTLQDQDKTPVQLRSRAEVDLELGDEGIKLPTLRLEVEGIVPDFTADAFDEAVAETEKSCPIYQLLKPGFEKIEVSSRLQL